MKNHIQNSFLVPALIAGLGLILTGRATAQTFTPLYSFTNSPDGAYPDGNLVLSGNTLYGTTTEGGITNIYGTGNGTVFAININGSNYTNLYLFGSTNNDGVTSETGLFLSGNTLYGTCYSGGVNGSGTVFSLNTSGSNYVILHNFTVLEHPAIYLYTNSDGAHPRSTLLLSGNTLYGTAGGGGTNGCGTVFSLNTSGSNFMVLHTFSRFGYGAGNQTTNSDGAGPDGTLLLSGNTLYGTTGEGGTNGNGTVFSMSTSGSNFMILHVFGAWGLNTNLNSNTNNDGAYPSVAGLILSGKTLYGTTSEGGPAALGVGAGGTVFSLNTNGTNFTVLHAFSGDTNGGYPLCGLILSGNTLFGTTGGGGKYGYGTVFSFSTNGTNFTVLHPFTAGSDGAEPQGLMLSGNTLYGIGEIGGTDDYGTVFSLTVTLPVAPQLAIARSGTNVILRWPTNATGYTLVSATNLGSPVWLTNSPAPVVVNTNNTVTNGISGTRKFYRLSQ
jgi:uncharacterized repeat protein (TIGR03803 family)